MQRLVLQKLRKNVGEGNYHFMIGGPQGPSGNVLDLDDPKLTYLESEETEQEPTESLILDGKVTSRRIDAAQ